MGVPIIGQYFENDQHQPRRMCCCISGSWRVTRARKLADILKTPIAIIDKRRPKPNVAEVMNIVGEIEGRTIIIDDIIDTAGTITLAAQALKIKVRKMYMLVVHILYSQVLQKNVLKIQRLKNLLLQIQSYLTIVKTIKHQRIM